MLDADKQGGPSFSSLFELFFGPPCHSDMRNREPAFLFPGLPGQPFRRAPSSPDQSSTPKSTTMIQFFHSRAPGPPSRRAPFSDSNSTVESTTSGPPFHSRALGTTVPPSTLYWSVVTVIRRSSRHPVLLSFGSGLGYLTCPCISSQTKQEESNPLLRQVFNFPDLSIPGIEHEGYHQLLPQAYSFPVPSVSRARAAARIIISHPGGRSTFPVAGIPWTNWESNYQSQADVQLPALRVQRNLPTMRKNVNTESFRSTNSNGMSWI